MQRKRRGEFRFMSRHIQCQSRISAVVTTALLLVTTSALAQQRQVLRSRVSTPANSQILGRIPDSQNMRLGLTLPLRNQQQLQTLLQQLSNPASPNYRKFLTVQQFTDQFGPSAEDYEKVIGFAKTHGLTVTRTFSNRLLVNVNGSASNVGQAFHTSIQNYQHPVDKSKFYAPDVEPTVEAGVPILSVDGLTNLNPPHPMLKHATSSEAVHSDATGSGQGGQFLGSDMRAAYAPGVTLDGSGQTVGLIELGPYN